MKVPRSDKSVQRFLCLFVLLVLTAVAGFIRFGASASNENGKTDKSPVSVRLKSPNTPVINLRPGYDLPTVYTSVDYSSDQLKGGQNQPLALASVDFDVDGYPDLAAVYASADGGILTFHKGNSEAFAPHSEESLALVREGRFPDAFLGTAESFAVPAKPDFLAAGDFDRDGNFDVVTATRGGEKIYLFSGKGREGGFNAPREIDLPGNVTAMTAGEIDASDNRADLIFAVENGADASLLVFENAESGIFGAAANYRLDAPAIALDLGKLDDDRFSDAAILTAEGVSILHGRGQESAKVKDNDSRLEKINLSFVPQALTVGDFIADRAGKMEMALLGADGTVRTAKRGELDERPFSIREAQANRAAQFIEKQTGGIGAKQKIRQPTAPENWTIDDNTNISVSTAGQPGSFGAPILMKANLSGRNTDDILFLNSETHEIKILSSPEPKKDSDEIISYGDGIRSIYTLEAENQPTAVLSMKLNIFARSGLVVLQSGKIEPSLIVAAPTATFVVDRTDDTNAASACMAAANDCSLRGAITNANGAMGADIITLPAGTYTLTAANGGGTNEDSNATGDLDITQDLTINGAGQATTIVQGGTTNANGIDKVFASNPVCTLPVSTSMTGLTVRFGRNTQPNGAADFSFTGGGMDWCNTGSGGTLTVTNSTFDNNNVINGAGGGINLDTSFNTSGSVSLTGVTISNNSCSDAVTGVSFPSIGGGLTARSGPFNVTITNSTVSGNNSRVRTGGGIAFNHNSNVTSTFLLSGVTVSNNQAFSLGGGVIFLGSGNHSFTLNQGSVVSGNTSGTGTAAANATAAGGGLFLDALGSGSNATVNRSTITGNILSPTTTDNRGGAGIFAGSGPITVSFNRIVGNTGTPAASGTGLRKDINSGATNAANNWWGCSTGPSAAPCDTAVISTGGAGSLTSTPFIVLRHTASPSTIVVGQTSTLTASFLTDSTNTPIALANISALIGLPITFNNPVRGTLSGAQATIQSNGTATATFTATTAGAGSADAIVDNDVAAAGRTNRAVITINQAGTTTGVTSSFNPSRVGQAVSFTATVAPVAPGGGTPTGTIQFVVDGVNFGAPVALSGGSATSGSTSSLTAGTHTVTANYSGDANNTSSSGSLAGGQVVIAPPTISKSFGAASILIGASTSLSFTITNPAANTVSLTGVGFTDTLPAGLVVATPNGLSGTCGGGTITAAAGSGTVSLSGATLGVNTNCTFSVNVTGTTGGVKNNSVTVNSTNGGTGNTATASVTVVAPPDLTITKTHAGNFTRGQVGAQYTITVTNSGGGSTSGTVTVVDTLPGGLTTTAISGTGWSCTLGTLTCTRSDALGAGLSYPSITLTVNVAINAPSSVTNTATVSGGGETDTSNNTANDVTTITFIITAASVEISGLVTTRTGQGLSSAQVTLTDRFGGRKTAVTSASGYFRFTDVPSGETYIISTVLEGYYFTSRVLNVTEDVTDLRIAAQ